MLARSFAVCLLIGLGSVPWTADATSKVLPTATTSTVARASARSPRAGNVSVTNRISRVATPIPWPAPPSVSKGTVARPPPAPVPQTTGTKPIRARLQLHPPSTGAVVRVSSARVVSPSLHVLVTKPASPTPPPRPAPTVSSDFKFGPKGLTRQIDRNWSMSFSAALSPSPSTSTQGDALSGLGRVMPVIKLEKTF